MQTEFYQLAINVGGIIMRERHNVTLERGAQASQSIKVIEVEQGSATAKLMILARISHQAMR